MNFVSKLIHIKLTSKFVHHCPAAFMEAWGQFSTAQSMTSNIHLVCYKEINNGQGYLEEFGPIEFDWDTHRVRFGSVWK